MALCAEPAAARTKPECGLLPPPPAGSALTATAAKSFAEAESSSAAVPTDPKIPPAPWQTETSLPWEEGEEMTMHEKPCMVCKEDWRDIVQCLRTVKTCAEAELYNDALNIFQRSFSTPSLACIPSLLEDLTDIWQNIVSLRSNVVVKGQTRTPRGLVGRMLSYVPTLCRGILTGVTSGDDSARPGSIRYSTVLDPASGAGILLASLCLRTLEQSSVVRHALQAAAVRLVDTPTNKSTESVFTKLISSTKNHLRSLVSCIHAVDIDEMSCTFTRMSLLCCFGPVLRALHVLEQGHDGSSHSSWALPRLCVFCGSSPTLFQGKDRTVNGLLAGVECPSECLSFLWGRSFDIVLQNPPYRNLERDRVEASGAAFQFLEMANTVSCWAQCSFRHHNLYGFFLRLGIDRLLPGGIMVAVVLRNVFDLHKYPQDVGFHFELLRDTSILAVDYGCFAGTDGEFRKLPMDIRHKRAGGIETATLVLRSERPRTGHKFRVRSASVAHSGSNTMPAVPAITMSEVEYEQSHLLSHGIGVTDPVLCSVRGADNITKNWTMLAQPFFENAEM